MKPLIETAHDLGVKAQYDTRVQTLGVDISIRARRGVVLATGSFVYNDEMLQDHVPRIAG
ncbi:hypothetical protein [Rhodococcus jostii]|uniref:hypothetical protein n=1 Tax=Rhodococcus jostii TaxID=132919 RepID=UPI0002D497BD